MRFDAGGKVALDHIYTQTDPRGYFGTLRDLDYVIPQMANPHFARLLDELRRSVGSNPLTVLDLGCGYGVNSALLRCDATMDELYRHYCGVDPTWPTRHSSPATGLSSGRGIGWTGPVSWGSTSPGTRWRTPTRPGFSTPQSTPTWSATIPPLSNAACSGPPIWSSRPVASAT